MQLKTVTFSGIYEFSCNKKKKNSLWLRLPAHRSESFVSATSDFLLLYDNGNKSLSLRKKSKKLSIPLQFFVSSFLLFPRNCPYIKKTEKGGRKRWKNYRAPSELCGSLVLKDALSARSSTIRNCESGLTTAPPWRHSLCV